MKKQNDIIIGCKGNETIDYVVEDWRKWKLNRLRCKNYRLKKKLENIKNLEVPKPIKGE